ncbi:MAG: phenylalanine--tRNA ligase subunit beta [Actinobacteria bacterium]|uniref:Phenylalanine--tRNA ligase beta subunit n=1 Tax=freshwater metagenome TaxID=449393 RepID=A0A6J5YFD6_9ZZZZ|nr:phenylalanine--tRNA ligase subunit beta [Actinomycetota bacterium]
MKVLLSWLQEFAPFPSDDPIALGDVMSDLGMAVESIDRIGEGLDGIVVAKVLELRRHPDADKIQLVDVDTGDGEPLQICCGATNLSVGDTVPLATLGTTMPDGMEIARRKMRGEWSNGMLCSGRELGLGDDHSGILLLDGALTLGTAITDALGITPDVLFDLEINPNRPDAMSVAGVARDLAARLGLPFSIPEPQIEEVPGDAASMVSVEIIDPDLCGRFYARVIEGISIEPSPRHIADRLVALGMRPINNVVDASNYVMLELGAPNHTYDLATLPDGALRVRWARDGEPITTLDGIERALTAGRDGVITDGTDQAVGIAGVMGGASTEISSSTTRVLLECAWWQPMAIARSSKFMGLRSEASARFERGTDPEILDLAARRLAELLAPSGARLVAGSVNVDGNLPDRSPITVRTDRVNRLLGTALESETIAALLRPIGFLVEPSDSSGDWSVTVPSFRPDTTTETDIIEEIARHHGYSRIPGRIPTSTQTGSLTPLQRDRRILRQVLVGLGVHEAMPLPFLAPGDLDRAGLPAAAVTLTNPLAAEESVLRTSLRPGLLRSIAYNESHRTEHASLFELGRVFALPGVGQVLPDEREHLAVILAGRAAPAAVEVLDVILETLGVASSTMDQSLVPAGLHPARSATVRIGDLVIGEVGEIDPAVLEAFSVRERTAWLQLDVAALLTLPHGEHPYRSISRYPSSDLDLAFGTPDDIAADALTDVIRSAAGALLISIELFDVFRGGAVPIGTRSLAYRLRLQAADRTLTDDDVATVMNSAVDAAARLGATLRA